MTLFAIRLKDMDGVRKHIGRNHRHRVTRTCRQKDNWSKSFWALQLNTLKWESPFNSLWWIVGGCGWTGMNMLGIGRANQESHGADAAALNYTGHLVWEPNDTCKSQQKKNVYHWRLLSIRNADICSFLHPLRRICIAYKITSIGRGLGE